MTYPLESSNSSGGGNILLTKIKIRNLELVTFRYLKTLVFDNFFKNYISWFYFWRVLLVITNPLFMIIRPCPSILYTYTPIHFRKIDMSTKIPGGFIRSLPPLFRRGMMSCLIYIFQSHSLHRQALFFYQMNYKFYSQDKHKAK